MNSSIQSHLYKSFLTGETSDVSIRITGAFNAVYRLHRVVLIQAGFWKNLFMGEFIEGSRKRAGHEEIFDVVLEDSNITRSAFELATSRLYGGGAPLYIHPSFLPTSTRPLTPGFPHPPTKLLYPPGHQPATSEFLLSLLATSLYLEISSLASEAMEAILKTIGPRTVQTYLNFALGNSKVVDPDLPAVGLDGLAEDLKGYNADLDINTKVRLSPANDYVSGPYSPLSVRSPSSTASLSSTSDESLVLSMSHTECSEDVNPGVPRKFYYGPVSDKIGEACACWLAKWGGDMFAEEEKVVFDWLSDVNANLDSYETERNILEGLPSDTIHLNTFVSAGLPPPSSSSASQWSPKWSTSKEKSIPRLFTATASGTGEGLSLVWIHALISSDGFFVPSPSLYTSCTVNSSSISVQPPPHGEATCNALPGPEEDRYAFAKRVVELRRAVRVKVRQLRQKQMIAEAERSDNENWDTVGEHNSGRRGRSKGKERATNVIDLHAEDSRAADRERSSDNMALPSRWELWSEAWKNERDEENAQWDVFFRSIYYSNMLPDAVINISRDLSPSTGSPYVDLRTLQEGAWQAGLVRFMTTSSPGEKLGVSKAVSDTLPSLNDSAFHDMKPHFVLPTDESLRIGDTVTASSGYMNEGNIHSNITMDELFASSFGGSYIYRRDHTKNRRGPPGKSMIGASSGVETGTEEKTVFRGKTSNEYSFFGLLGSTHYLISANAASNMPSFVPSLFPPSPTRSLQAASLLSTRLSPSQLISPHPPLRFSIEFFNLEMLKEKDRLNSRTVWFAGSLWNVYVQIVKRKEKTVTPNLHSSSGAQPGAWAGNTPGSGLLPNHHLGVYLHRQSPTDDPPPFSAPDPFADTRWSLKGSSHSPSTQVLSSSTQNMPGYHPSPVSCTPSQVSRGPAFSPLTPYASAPQVSSNSVTGLRSPSASASRLRGNSTSATSSSSRPATAPGAPPSPPSSPRPRTPGSSGGWRNLGASSNSPNSTSSSGGLLSSSLPTVFPTFGRTRHQSSGSRDVTRRNIEYASVSNSYITGLSPSPPPNPSSPTTAPISSITEPSLPNPPFQATSTIKPTYPYLDHRPVVSVYFSVICASPTGSAQTQFRSGPDVFKVGQSWGWKSSGLVGSPRGSVSSTDGDFESALLEMDNELLPVGHEVSLRATVVLGLV